MQRLQHVRFAVPDGRRDQVRQILTDLALDVPSRFTGEDSEVLATSHSLLLPAESDVLSQLLDRLRATGIDQRPFIRPEAKYTKAEMRQAHLFWVQPQYQPDDGYDVFGTQYNREGVCRTCGSTPRQIGPLALQTQKFTRYAFSATHNLELIVSSDLSKRLQVDFTGFKTQPIVDTPTGQRDSSIEQLVPTAVLPKLAAPTVLHHAPSEYCSVCGQNGVYVHSEVHISEPPDEHHDVFRTAEVFGAMRTRGCPGPLLIVSRHVVTLIREYAPRSIRVEPVSCRGRVFSWPPSHTPKTG